MYLVRKTERKCMNVDIDKYCSIMEFPFTRIQIILGLYITIEKVFPTFDDVS